MVDKNQLADDLERAASVERADAGVTDGVVKAEIRNGEYDSLTPEIMETLSGHPLTVSPVGGKGYNYYIVLE